MRRLLAFVLLGACTETFPAELRAVAPELDAAVPNDASVDGSVDDVTTDAATDVVIGSTVNGEVWFPDGGQTSVLLAREADFEQSDFYDKLPSGPQVFGITGTWSLPDVPAGTYWVLAGYGNDGFVSASPAPTKIVVAGSQDEIVSAGTQYLFRALKIASISPKASAAGVTIVDIDGEDEYRVTVVDFMDKLVYSKAEPPSATGGNLTFTIGVGLTVPLRYRVRVVAMKGGVELTRTEDLVGVFTAQPDDT